MERPPRDAHADPVPLDRGTDRVGLEAGALDLGEKPGHAGLLRDPPREHDEPPSFRAAEEAERLRGDAERPKPRAEPAPGARAKRLRSGEGVEQRAHPRGDRGIDRVDRGHAARRGRLLRAKAVFVLQDVELERRDDVPPRGESLPKGRHLEGRLAREEEAGKEEESDEQRRAPRPPAEEARETRRSAVLVAPARFQDFQGFSAHLFPGSRRGSTSHALRTRG